MKQVFSQIDNYSEAIFHSGIEENLHKKKKKKIAEIDKISNVWIKYKEYLSSKEYIHSYLYLNLEFFNFSIKKK